MYPKWCDLLLLWVWVSCNGLCAMLHVSCGCFAYSSLSVWHAIVFELPHDETNLTWFLVREEGQLVPLWAHLHYTWTEKRRRFVRGLILERRWKVVGLLEVKKYFCLILTGSMSFPLSKKHEMPICRVSFSVPGSCVYCETASTFLCVVCCVCFVFEGSRDTHESTNRSKNGTVANQFGSTSKSVI